MTLHRSFRLLLVLAAAACLASPASAGVRRFYDPDRYLDFLDLGDQHPNVGYIWMMQDDLVTGAGSGVLIAPHWVLTAAHLFDDTTNNRYRFGIRTTPNLYDDGTLLPPADIWVWEYDAAKWIIHPDWVGEANGGLSKGSDLALLYFDENIAQLEGALFPEPPIPHITSVEPAKLYTGNDELDRVGTAVGFGLVGTGDTEDDPSTELIIENRGFGPPGTPYYRWAGKNVIDELLGNVIDEDLGTVNPEWSMDILLSDFDNPIAEPPTNDDSDNSWGDPLPRELEYLVFLGDSGGGLFIEDENGETVLAGLHSFTWPRLDGIVDSDYGDASGHTRISAYADWIYATIPEPSSIIVWSLIVGLSMAGGWRRRKRA